MTSRDKHKRVRILITIQDSDKNIKKIKELNKIMNDRNMPDNRRNAKFICSICLNTKRAAENIETKCGEIKSKSCPICKIKCEACRTNSNETVVLNEKIDKCVPHEHASDLKEANFNRSQTSQKDITQGINLLNEVLTVFQNKKNKDPSKQHLSSKPTYKDVSISTDLLISKEDSKRKLSVSKVFQCAIDSDHKINSNGKYTMVNYHQPQKSDFNLINRKSSSTPQMKMDELKKYLKEKSKPKNALDEVNRMFATVRKMKDDERNRPIVRNGPRVLPVAKNISKNYTSLETTQYIDGKHPKSSCKCYGSDDFLSSGDTSAKYQYCHHCEIERCDKCIYMMCCHYQNHRHQMQAGVLIHERCRNSRGDFVCKHNSGDDCNN